jgi:Family of unknown function (DUF6065)
VTNDDGFQMKLSFYVFDGQPFDLRPAPLDRAWMDASPERFAYRCLPLSIANAHGWEILCPSGFTATWNGNADTNAITITPDAGTKSPAVSHFGSGVLTFHVHGIVRTEPGYDLMVQGPVNAPKDGIAALTGAIETDWAPYSFTMNWLFTRANASIRFAAGEPFCHVFPIRRGALEDVKPELHLLSEAPELKKQYDQWRMKREFFNMDLKRRGSRAQNDKWQKLYHRGLNPDGTPTDVKDHRTRIRLKPFVKSAAFSRSQRPPN